MCTFFNATLADKLHKWHANAFYVHVKRRAGWIPENEKREAIRWLLQFVHFIVEKLPYLRALLGQQGQNQQQQQKKMTRS